MIDLHAHVLPGVDDGPADVEQALAIVARAARDGTRTIAATSHLDLHHRQSPAGLLRACRAFAAQVEAAGLPVAIVPGAEVALERLIDLPSDELLSVSLGGGGCVLIEAPQRRLPGDVLWPLRDLLERFDGRVLLAHAERIPAFQDDVGQLDALLERGALCQVTVGSLLGQFGPRARELALELLRAGKVHDLASDGHDVRRRPVTLGAGLEVLAAEGLGALGAWLTQDAPAAILAGAALPPAPAGVADAG